MGSNSKNLFTWDANSLLSSSSRANQIAYGRYDSPRYDLEKAQFIVGIGTDFQDSGTSKLYNTIGFTKSHSYKNGKKGRFVQFESHYTITGSCSDDRYSIPPGSETVVALLLLKALNSKEQSKKSSRSKLRLQKFYSRMKNCYLVLTIKLVFQKIFFLVLQMIFLLQHR